MQTTLMPLCYLLFLSNCGTSQPTSKVLKVEYVSVGRRIMTPARIECNYFDTAFAPKMYSHKTISELSTTKAFDSLLSKIKFSKVDYELDVRSKIYIHFFNVKDSMVICIGQNNLLKVDGRTIENNEEILSEIKELISK